ncbi:hypothetical protein VE03_03007 [Pseudogymnoascus sp. 23342-1-I1]|nr:hypothetical protein VE03_03007 [Pseudogymnoascus sp. 23342-1-I1]
MASHTPDNPDSARPTSSGSAHRFTNLGRRRTLPSEPTGLRQTSSFATLARRLTEASHQPDEPKLEQGTFPVYFLRWEKLRVFLEGRFPGYTFPERIVENDKYIFKIPEPLTEEDRVEIRKLLDLPDKAVEARSSSRSPERGATLSRMMMQS